MSVWRLLSSKWRRVEDRMTASIVIQCKFRIFIAKKRIRLKIRDSVKFNNAALAIQRAWYSSRNEFASFFVMSAYRARRTMDEEDRKIEKKKNSGGMVEKIQRAIRGCIKVKFYNGAVMIQKSYRRLCAVRYTEYLRKKRVAGRKIRFWLKFSMRKRHMHARTIQRIWWGRKPGRLLRHLIGELSFILMDSCGGFCLFCYGYLKRFIIISFHYFYGELFNIMLFVRCFVSLIH